MQKFSKLIDRFVQVLEDGQHGMCSMPICSS